MTASISKALKQHVPWNHVLAYVLCSATCTSMVLYRYGVTGKTTYAWLVVPNLVLAWMPLCFALAIHVARELGWRNRWLVAGLGGLWLLFFPNAPYIVTDLVHLTYFRDSVSIYFDIALITLAAVTGLGLAFNSLGILHDLMVRRTSRLVGWLFAISTCILSSVGIYLGRVERWNSWDMLRSPLSIINDLLAALRAGELLPIVVSYSLITVSLYVVFRSRQAV